MKKLINLSLIALFSIFLLSSCGSKNTEDMLVGTWVLKKSELKNWDDIKGQFEELGLSGDEFKKEFETVNDEEMQLNEDHTAKMSESEGSGKWSYDKDKNALVLEAPDGSKLDFLIQSISNDKMVVLYTIDDDETGMKMEFLWTFEKKK